MTEKQFIDALENADRVIASWPAWKRASAFHGLCTCPTRECHCGVMEIQRKLFPDNSLGHTCTTSPANRP